jgi:shikimate kinase/3-dehydroquinate synthase
VNNVVLVGFMGSGKSTVGPILAGRLKRPFVDLDHDIAADVGYSVAEIFDREGESGFRERESRGLERALERDDAVIAVGGGAPLRQENWSRIREGNCVAALIAEPAELGRRLNGSSGRPLLQPDVPSAIASLLPRRMSRYLEADVVMKTDGLEPAEVARQLEARLPGSGLQRIRIEVPGSPHELAVGTRLTGLVAGSLQRMAVSGTAVVVGDERVAERHAHPLIDALSSAGIAATLHLVPAGEPAKELGVLAGIYHALAAAEVDRQGALVALGGGTVGDVAGLAAATWMRGIRYLQLPTTLLAMVDSSIGGKTAINLPAGKNLVGAVHQPSAIFCDLDYLSTLPDGDYRAALAEIIKAAVIADRPFVDWLSVNLPAVLRRQPDAIREAVVRAIAIKAAVVARDPQEVGERAILNYGHTVGHALERTAGFGQLRHGVAVAWGMEVAARISGLMGVCSKEAVAVQHGLLQDAGLLDIRPAVSHAELMEAMRHDKKSRSGEMRWVLLREVGRADYGQRVDPSVVRAGLAEVL